MQTIHLSNQHQDQPEDFQQRWSAVLVRENVKAQYDTPLTDEFGNDELQFNYYVLWK